MFVFSLIPYLTIFAVNNPNSLLAESWYGLDFIIINMVLFLMAKYLIKINSDSEYLKYALNLKNTVYIPLLIFIVGLIIAFLGYPIAISICCLITIVRSIIVSLKY